MFYGAPAPATNPEDHLHHHHQQQQQQQSHQQHPNQVQPKHSGASLEDSNRFGPTTTTMYGSIDSLTSGRDNRVIAKPLPNRPTPFIAAAAAAAAAGHGGLNHPHLHSLLTHCRNPYLGGGGAGGGGEWLENEMMIVQHLNSNYRLSSQRSPAANVPGQMFPLPGPGFPWAHSNRGKPRRGMMRRAVFSGGWPADTQVTYISSWAGDLITNLSPHLPQTRSERGWRSGFRFKSTSASRIAKNSRNGSG